MLKVKIKVLKNDVCAANGDKGEYIPNSFKHLVSGDVVELHVMKIVPWNLIGHTPVPCIQYSFGKTYSRYLPLECFEIL
jgi:hypothetical protein